MGSSASKAAAKTTNAAAGAARRKYPTRLPPNPSPSANTSLPSTNATTTTPPPAGQPATPGPTVHPENQASYSKDASIALDASDPDFAASLRSLGPVTPSSTMSNSSTFSSRPSATMPSGGSDETSASAPSYPGVFPDQSQNPALQILVARDRIAAEAEKEFGIARVTGGGTGGGRKFIDVGTIREVLVLRDIQKLSAGEIERRLGLKSGVVAMLSRVGEARIGAVDAGDSGIY